MSTAELNDVYITSMGKFLPGNPVSNDEMEAKLGLVGGKPSRYRRAILRNNRIKSRHYALDDEGQQTHLNEQLAAAAINDALANSDLSLEELQMLSVGTTMPDLLMPGFASMVHGRLGGAPMDILSAAGICASGMAAFKSAWLAVKAGQHDAVVAAGSELPSRMFKASRFEKESEVAPEREGTAESFEYFNADFLRWMLSDGAGAAIMQNKPAEKGLSLKVEFVELRSYAHEYPTCMYLGSEDPSNPQVGNTWLDKPNATAAEADGMMVIRQDTTLLGDTITPIVADEAKRLFDRGMIKADEIDHFLPHLSSYFFHDHLAAAMEQGGIPIPREKWWTNLATKGNTGAASIYIMLEEALNEGRFKPGDKILTMVPESGRFAVSYSLFTCVGEPA